MLSLKLTILISKCDPFKLETDYKGLIYSEQCFSIREMLKKCQEIFEWPLTPKYTYFQDLNLPPILTICFRIHQRYDIIALSVTSFAIHWGPVFVPVPLSGPPYMIHHPY